MMATWTLFRLQLRIMRWPIIAVVFGFVVLFLPGRNEIRDLLCSVGGLANILVVALAGSFLFGVEYQEGARDYLATRPIPPRTVLTVKVLLILVLSLLGVWVMDGTVSLPQSLSLTHYYYWVTPLVWAILLDISLLSSAMTVLCKDLVRGLLYGASPVMILSLVGWFFLYDLWHSGSAWDNNYFLVENVPDPLGFVVGTLAVVLSPALSLAALLSAFESSRFGKWTMPMGSWLLIFFYMGFLAFSGYTLHTDGSVKSEFYPDSLAGKIFSKDPDNTHLWFRSGMKEDILLRYDPLNFQAGPDRTITYERQWVGKDTKYNSIERIIGDYLLVSRTEKISEASSSEDLRQSVVDIYCVTNSGQFRFVKSVDIPIRIYGMNYLGNEKVEFLYYGKSMIPHYTLDLNSLEILRETNNASDYDGWKSCVQNNLQYRTIGENLVLENITLPVGNRMVLETPRKSTANTAVNGDVIAIHSITRTLCNGFVSELSLFVRDKDNHYIERKLDIPFHAGMCPWLLLNIGRRIGINIFNWDDDDILISDGYLALWLGSIGRVIMWDIQNPDKPEYLGTVQNIIQPQPLGDQERELFPRLWTGLNGSTTPFVREDGALGYLIYDRILWLQFPALMKEAKS